MALSEKMLEKIDSLAGDEGFWDDQNKEIIMNIADYLITEKKMAQNDVYVMLVDLWNAIADEVSC